jgi:hypothetical protein
LVFRVGHSLNFRNNSIEKKSEKKSNKERKKEFDVCFPFFFLYILCTNLNIKGNLWARDPKLIIINLQIFIYMCYSTNSVVFFKKKRDWKYTLYFKVSPNSRSCTNNIIINNKLLLTSLRC